MPAKHLVVNGVGARMERTGGTKRSHLRIFGDARSSPRHCVNHNTSIQAGGVKEIMADICVGKSYMVVPRVWPGTALTGGGTK